MFIIKCVDVGYSPFTVITEYWLHPHVVHCILVACLIPRGLYLLLSYPCISPPTRWEALVCSLYL